MDFVPVPAPVEPLATPTRLRMPARVVNPSTKRQARWVTVAMPKKASDNLPPYAVVDGRWLAVKGKAIDNVQHWLVRPDVPARGSIGLFHWTPLPDGVPKPTFIASDRLTVSLPKLEDLLSVLVSEDCLTRVTSASLVNALGVTLAPNSVVLHEQTPVSQVWKLECHNRGWHAVFFLTVYSGQDVADLRGYVWWADGTRSEWKTPGSVEFLLYSDTYAIDLYFPERSGFQKNERGDWVLGDAKIPHGFGIPVRGVLSPKVQVAPRQIGQPADFDEFRNQLIEAAKEAPLVALAERLPVLGEARDVSRMFAHTTQAEVLSWCAQPGSIFDPLPFANNANTGSTGDQACFGAVMDDELYVGNAWQLYRMLYCADDYLLRGRHLSPEPRNLPADVQTWSGSIEERASPNTLGKSRTPENNWHIVGSRGRSVLIDDQHRGDNYLFSTYVRTNDPLLYWEIMVGLEVDSRRAMPARGWVDAPRASGRLMQSWANVVRVASESHKIAAARLIQYELEDRIRVRSGHPHNLDQVVVMETGVSDNVVPGRQASVPWNEALAILGAYAAYLAVREYPTPEDPILAEKLLTFAVQHSQQLFKWGTIVDSTTGKRYPINGLLWTSPTPNPASYYEYPRAGTEGMSRDILVGGTDWWDWWGGVLAVLFNESFVARQVAVGRVGEDDPRTSDWFAFVELGGDADE